MGLMTLKEIRNQLKSEGKRVYIPLYQRNYRWPAVAGDDGISAVKLIKDIVAHMPENDFVLGMITIYKDHDGNIQVLDGQQRLITLSLIVKALNDGDIDENNWINLEFERDPGFSKSDGENSTPRHDFLFKKESDENSDHDDVNSVDVNRMRNNYVAIKKFIDDKEKEDIFRFMLEHIRLFLHETKREPIDEFLNINFNKTPFCAADYIKSYMILDAADDTDNKANSVQGHTENIPVSVQDIMGLWRSMAYDLYQLNELTVEHSGSDENDMYMLIKDGYKQLEKSRMEILFEDYYYDNDNDKVKLVKEKYHAKDAETRLKNQYDELLRYHKLMQELLQELIVVDKDGNRHPNCTAYGAFRQLRKSKDLTFFSLFDNSNKTIQEGLYKEFNPKYKYNLEMRSYENINRDPQTVNRFMHAMLATTTGGGNEVEAEHCEGIDEEQRFNGYNKIFDDSFTTFIDIIERAKKCNAEDTVDSQGPKAMEETISNSQPDQITEPVPLEKSFELEQKPYTLEELFTNPHIRQIKIPRIQRDYVMGGAVDYLKKYLLRIRTEELNKQKMNGSCIMGHLDKQGVFWVYDGQQRITTLVIILIYTISTIKDDDDGRSRKIRKSLEKFSFEGRDGANSILGALIDDPSVQAATLKKYIKDQSSYSMYCLWKHLEGRLVEEKDIHRTIVYVNPLYIWKNMDFELVLLDEVGDAEHMFIELNEGFKLGEAEQYKAQLCHRMNKMRYKKEKEVSIKIDNMWLNHFKSEEKEVDYIKDCVDKYAYYEVKAFKFLEDIDSEVLDIAFNAMDTLVSKEKEVNERFDKLKEGGSNISITWEKWLILMDFADSSCFKPLTLGFNDNDMDCLYFSFNDFFRLMDLYISFIPRVFNELFFKHVHELRKNKYICIRDEAENDSDETRNNNMSISIAMLKSRMDAFKYYYNARKWEKDWEKDGVRYDNNLVERPYSFNIVVNIENLDNKQLIETYSFSISDENQYKLLAPEQKLEQVVSDDADERRIYKNYESVIYKNESRNITIKVYMGDDKGVSGRYYASEAYNLKTWYEYAEKERLNKNRHFVRPYYRLLCDYADISKEDLLKAQDVFEGKEDTLRFNSLCSIIDNDDCLKEHKESIANNVYSWDDVEQYLIQLYWRCGTKNRNKKDAIRSFICKYIVHNIDSLTGWMVSFAVCQRDLYPPEYNGITKMLIERYIKTYTKKEIPYSEEYEKLLMGVLSKDKVDDWIRKIGGENVNS